MIITTTALARTLDDDALRHAAPSVFAVSPWGRMSGRYRMVPTIDVVGMLRDKGFQPVRAEQSPTRIPGKGDFTRHMLRFRHADHLSPRAVGAEVPEVVLVNSHDGTSAYKFLAGIFRLVCSNGMIVQSSDHGSISVRHSGGSDFRDRVVDATCRIMDDASRTLAKIETWKQIELTPPQRDAFATAALESKDHCAVTPAQLLARRPQDGPLDDRQRGPGARPAGRGPGPGRDRPPDDHPASQERRRRPPAQPGAVGAGRTARATRVLTGRGPDGA